MAKTPGNNPTWRHMTPGSGQVITAPNSIWAWKFPKKPGLVGYCVRSGIKLTGKTAIHWKFRIEGNAVFAPYHPEQEGKPCKTRLYFQRAGDDYSGSVGKYEFYRWWGNGAVQVLANQSFNVTVPLDPAQWGSVYGKTGVQAGVFWDQALANVVLMGFTFGGASFAGHGVVLESGASTFALESYDIT